MIRCLQIAGQEKEKSEGCVMKNTTDVKLEGILKERSGALNASLAVLERLGVTKMHAERIRTDEPYAERVAAAMKYGTSGSIYYQVAREIMRENYFGPEDWHYFFGLDFTKKQLARIAEFPWGEEILYGRDPFDRKRTIRATHFAWLGLKKWQGSLFTLRSWESLAHEPNSRLRKMNIRFWGDEEKGYKNRFFDMAFAETATCDFCWYLMPIEYSDRFMKERFDQQVEKLPEGYRIGYAIEEFTKGILYWVKHEQMAGSQHLDEHNKEKFVRCRDDQPHNHRVSIGYFHPTTMIIGSGPDFDYSKNVGLSIARMNKVKKSQALV